MTRDELLFKVRKVYASCHRYDQVATADRFASRVIHRLVAASDQFVEISDETVWLTIFGEGGLKERGLRDAGLFFC